MLTGEDFSFDSTFGYNLEVSGDFLVISTYREYVSETGAIYIYKFSDELYERTIIGPEILGIYGDKFGGNLIVRGDMIITSAYGYEDKTGAVFIYDLVDEGYERILQPSDVSPGDRFGQVITEHEDYYAVSSAGYNNSKGALYLYKFDDQTYERKITEEDTQENAGFGFSIYFHNEYLFIANNSYDDKVGIVYLYKTNDELYRRIISPADKE